MILNKNFLAGFFSIFAASLLVSLAYNAMGARIPFFESAESPVNLSLEEGLPGEDGIHLVGFDDARRFYETGAGAAVLDARTRAEYEEGHIRGALICPVFEFDRYLGMILDKVPLDSPVMTYCSNDDCEDSRFLAESLEEVGYSRIYVYLGGYKEWLEHGMPVKTGTVNPGRQTPEQGFSVKRAVDFSGYLPWWFWLSGDFLILGCGLLAVWLLATGRADSGPARFAVGLVGFIFAFASLHKITSPEEFVRIIENYKIISGAAVNLAAVVMPWLELLCGLLLLSGRLRQESGAMVLILAGCFILAVGFNVARGLDFDCGCFGSGHVPPWRVLLRDIGLFCLCLPALAERKVPCLDG